MEAAVSLTFIAYFAILLVIGFFFYKRSMDTEEYLLGGRKMGAWVTAFSAQASDMSGWLLMGLPGAIYLVGFKEGWIAVGLLLGTFLNWYLVAGRLRIFTHLAQSITLPCFLERRFQDPTGLLRTASAIIILIFFTLYASSGLVAAGRLYESSFAVSYQTTVCIGGGIIVFYTFLGGFKAVCWTDLLQGSLMILALVVVPLSALHSEAAVGLTNWSNRAKQDAFSCMAVISALSWGLG